MAIELYRVDDRLVHGQVVVGWGQPLSISFLAVVDDEVATSEWEQELYRMGVPPEMDIFFASVDDAAAQLDRWIADERPGILLTADIATMARLIERRPEIRQVNLGGIHHRPDRSACVRHCQGLRASSRWTSAARR